MSKRIAALAVMFLILTSLTIKASSIAEMIEIHRSNIRVVIDNQKIELEEQPFIYNGRVYVPLRFVSTALGREAYWNSQISAVVINNPDIKLPLTECRPDEGEIFVYGEILDINYEDYLITIQQHYDHNSIQVENPLQISRDVVIVVQKDAEKNIHFYQLERGSTGGFVLDSAGKVRGIII